MPEHHSNFGDLVGLRGYEVEDGNVVVPLHVDDRHLNSMGLVHGGMIATLADNSMGIACFLSVGKPLVTVEFKLSFLRPVRKGGLRAKSRVNKIGEHLLFVGCQIDDDSGFLVAEALGTYMTVNNVP